MTSYLINKISLATCKQILQRLLPGEYSEFFPNIDAIHILAEANDLNPVWQMVPDWDAFQADEISGDEFVKHLLSKTIADRDRIILVTDEGLHERIAFDFIYRDLNLFIESYEETYQMQFMQDADYIFIVEEKKWIGMLMHEGHMCSLQL